MMIEKKTEEFLAFVGDMQQKVSQGEIYRHNAEREIREKYFEVYSKSKIGER